MSTIPNLYVEGTDDKHTIIQLLMRHGIVMEPGRHSVELKDAKGVTVLLDNMVNAIKASTDRPIGFALDIDTRCEDRWKAVRDRLIDAGIPDPDKMCPPEGYVGKVPDYPHAVGVWMMPDCSTDFGKLENFLDTLVPASDSLRQLAEQSTVQAKAQGAAFTDPDRIKAVLHCWLAWQAEPGVPFGVAVKAKYFNHNSPQALAFLSWLTKLFDLKPTTPGSTQATSVLG